MTTDFWGGFLQGPKTIIYGVSRASILKVIMMVLGRYLYFGTWTLRVCFDPLISEGQSALSRYLNPES